MKMTPTVLVLGSLAIFWATVFGCVYLPWATMSPKPSDIWRPMTAQQLRGRELYAENGCTYCHSQYVRTMDWGLGAERLSQAGDYHNDKPHLLGSERTGPDLSQAGGEHSDDWHHAHFVNPRFTSPRSLMPQFGFFSRREIEDLTAYVQSLGGHDADQRMARQRYWQQQAIAAFEAGPDANIEWIHSTVPQVWRDMPNPYPATRASLARGERVYQDYCVGCHGPVGDGQGPAAKYLYPPPLNFTTLRRHLQQGRYIGGILYYQIMNGITGTSMPYWKKHLTSNKIWDVSNYIAVNFIGYTDGDIAPAGIDAALEPPDQVAPNATVVPDGTALPGGVYPTPVPTGPAQGPTNAPPWGGPTQDQVVPRRTP